jgi:hypothetical protein
MSNRPEDRIPLYEVRIALWERVLDASELASSGPDALAGVDSWNERARTRFEAARADFRRAVRDEDVIEGGVEGGDS